jgi:hypothetical protein
MSERFPRNDQRFRGYFGPTDEPLDLRPNDEQRHDIRNPQPIIHHDREFRPSTGLYRDVDMWQKMIPGRAATMTMPLNVAWPNQPVVHTTVTHSVTGPSSAILVLLAPLHLTRHPANKLVVTRSTARPSPTLVPPNNRRTTASSLATILLHVEQPGPAPHPDVLEMHMSITRTSPFNPKMT